MSDAPRRDGISSAREPAGPPWGASRPGSARRFGGWRGWALRIILVLVSPVAFCGLAELTLKALGYGYESRFFLGPDERGRYRANAQFGRRFFPRHLAREPEPCLLASRSPGTTRIYVLGESAAMGMPNPAFSFGRILELMLHERYPGCQFEVVNTAMTAINSHVILEIAKDCAAQGGDLFVVYMGNNEVVGPYGPGTVFQQAARSTAAIRASVWLQSTRSGQFLADMINRMNGQADLPATWQGLQMFLGNRVASSDPRMTRVYENFRRNLADICEVAASAKVGVALTTVAVNLKDCPPLASVHRSDLSPTDLARWETLYASGADAASRSQWTEAVGHWEKAAEIDDCFAELQYRLGQGLGELDRWAEARERFSAARDLDALRFRADSRINAIIREVAASRKDQNVHLVDADHVFGQGTGWEGIPGERQFYEHVHLTFEGNYLLAKAVLEQSAAAFASAASSSPGGQLLDIDQCAKRLAWTRWDEFHMTETMARLTAQPPFTDQVQHAARQAAADQRVEDLRRTALAPEALREAMATYERALAGRPDDWYLHDRWAYLAKFCSAWDVAEVHWRTVLRDFPWLTDRRIQLAEVLLNQGSAAEAAAEFRTALSTNPQHAGAHNGLGMALLRQGELQTSIEHFRQALQLDTGSYAARVNLGLALGEQGKLDEAIVQFREALRVDSSRTEARFNLTTLLFRKGHAEEALEHLRELVRLQPENLTWLNQLAMTLATYPDATIRNGKEAVQLAERLIALAGGQDPVFLDSLAAAYAEIGDFAKAVQTAEQATALAYRQNNFSLASTLRARTNLYKTSTPLRDPRE